MSWLRDPLVHFVLVGSALFGLHRVFGRTEAERVENVIIVSDEDVTRLVAEWESAHARAPDPTELRQQVERFVRDAILYHEALALGLERDDPVVRARLIQLLESQSNESPDFYETLRARYEVILSARLAP